MPNIAGHARQSSGFFRFGLALGVAQAVLGAAVAHQLPQFADIHIGYLVHADQHRCAYRQATVADLADDRRRHFERPRQRGIVFQIEALISTSYPRIL